MIAEKIWKENRYSGCERLDCEANRLLRTNIYGCATTLIDSGHEGEIKEDDDRRVTELARNVDQV